MYAVRLDMFGNRTFGRMVPSEFLVGSPNASSEDPGFLAQPSSISTNWYPYSDMPDAIIASAALRMSASAGRSYSVYQPFHPICGVRPSLLPTTIMKERVTRPREFTAFNVTG